MEFTLTFLTFDLFNFTNMQNGALLGYIGILSSILQGGYVRRRAAGPIVACGLYWMAGSEKCYGAGAFSML
ncbi:4496_t:CDS:2, partial [Racocetra fulgida]